MNSLKRAEYDAWIKSGRVPPPKVLRSMAKDLRVRLRGVMADKRPSTAEKQAAWALIKERYLAEHGPGTFNYETEPPPPGPGLHHRRGGQPLPAAR